MNKDLSRTRLDRGSKLLQLLTRILHLFIPDVFFFRIKVSSNTWDHMPLRNLQEVSLLFHLKKTRNSSRLQTSLASYILRRSFDRNLLEEYHRGYYNNFSRAAKFE